MTKRHFVKVDGFIHKSIRSTDIKSFDSYSAKRVSYILPTKNRRKFLESALERFRTLIKPEDELIIVDGGSKDETEKIVTKFSDLVDIFISEKDRGIGHALNKGLLLARGKYIKNLSDDDFIYPESMEEVIEVLEKHPEVDLLICGGTKQRGRNFTVFYVPEGANYGNDINDIINYGACGVGHVIRRKSLALSGLYQLDVACDFTFPIQCIAGGLVVKFCRINLFHHPIYDHSTIIAKDREHRRDYDQTLSRYLSQKNYIKYKFLRTWALWPEYTEKLYKIFPLAKTIFWPARILKIKMNSIENEEIRYDSGTNLNLLVSNKRYKWDGGFS